MNASMTLHREVTVTATLSSAPRSRQPVRVRSADADGDRSPRFAESRDAFHLYLREIGPLPLLTPEEETSLACRARHGDDAAREALIKGNLRLVVKIARDYENLGVPLLDLIAEGNTGLMKAVDRFDPSRGAKLSVYSSFWIKQSIRRALGNQSRTVRVPIHIHGKLFKLDRITRRLHEWLGRAPTDVEVAHEAGLPPDRIAKLRLATLSFSSLDAPTGANQETSLAETLPDEQAGTPYEHLAGETLRELLRAFLNDLSAREVYVLRLRYGLDGEEELTLDDVGARLDLTRERVRQIQEAALKKLHRWISKREAAHEPEARANKRERATSCSHPASV